MTELKTAMEQILANDEALLDGFTKLRRTFSDLGKKLREIGAPGLSKSVAPCDRAIASIEEAMSSLKASMETSRSVVSHQSTRTLPLATSGGVAVGKVVEVLQ
jgi:hypothetical protein